MGLTESKMVEEDQKIGIGRFTDDKEYKLYHLVDTNTNEGELLPWMRYALNSGDHSLIDGYLDSKLKEHMYNGGKGRLEAVAELVKIRNKERNAMLGTFSRKKGKGKSGPNILEDFNQENNQGDLKKALKLLDGGKNKGEAKYREIVWKLDVRGRMGENIVGACLMQGSVLHNKLAIKLLDHYPNLVNDIFISEDYYGLSALHQAIVNEDPYMTRYLLQHGADVNQRCYGAFFCPDDQKTGRTDSLEHEFVDLPAKTNYVGRMYFGEYPLAFAACTNQQDCYRLLRAKKADPNQKDTNGNTVLHMTVIHENLEMLKLAYDTGAKLQIVNNEKLTPLTLAAKVAKKKMFEQILRLESLVAWDYGDASSTLYPLAKIDTINQETGHLNDDSALFLAAYGETEEHLNMLDGLLEEILQAKWDSFARRKWAISLFWFVIYMLFVFTAFMNRPFSLTTSTQSYGNKTLTGIGFDGQNFVNTTRADGSVIQEGTVNFFSSLDVYYWYHNETESSRDETTYMVWVNETATCAVYTALNLKGTNTLFDGTFIKVYDFEEVGYNSRHCHLTQYLDQGVQGYARLISECFVVAAVVFQIIQEIFEIKSIGLKRWWQVLKSFPFKALYRISLILILILVPVRYACFWQVMLFFDNMISIFVILFTSLHMLFYLRAIKFVGPFVVMIYTILIRDMTRFLLIYFVFLFGFAQSFFLIFVACERLAPDPRPGSFILKNIMETPFEAVLRSFIMTIGEFTVLYKGLNDCGDGNMGALGKVVFFIYEIVVSLLQLNLLIAMMTRTYEQIYSTQKEYKRQWAQVILMQELSMPPKDRLMALLKYSRPLGTDKRKRAFVVTRKTDLESLTESEKLMREQQINAIREEKQMLLKRRLREMHVGPRIASRTGLRPFTGFGMLGTPMPPPKWRKEY